MKLILELFRDLLIRLFIPKRFVKYFIEPREVVWLIHPGSIEDFTKKFSFLRVFSERFILFLTKFIWPFITLRFSFEENKISGYGIAVPLLSKQIEKNKKLSIKKIVHALKLANKIGAKYVSLGGLFPSIVYENNLDKIFPIRFFDGLNLLANLALRKINNILREENKKPEDIVLGIIGTKTKIGTTLTKLLSYYNFKQICLFDRHPESINDLKKEFLKINNKTQIETSNNFNILEKCDFVVLTAYLNEDKKIFDYFKKEAVAINTVEPISPSVFEIQKQRQDVKTITRISIIDTPGVIYDGYKLDIPPHSSFACLASALTLINNVQYIQSFLATDPKESLKSIEELFNKYKFQPL